jgi:hypothetical protein
VKFKQLVRVAFPEGVRQYTYAHYWTPGEEQPLVVGDLVRVPATSVSDDEQVCVVVALGSSYNGPTKEILGRVSDDD